MAHIFIYSLFPMHCGGGFISLAPSFHFSSTKSLISLAPSFPQGYPKMYTGLRDALVAPAPSRGRDNATCNIT
jgi:hypothetical protein